MYKIYGQAKQVVVWLGNCEVSTDDVSSLTQDLDAVYAKANESDAEDTDADSRPLSRVVMTLLDAILGHPWWTRIWNVQESADATELKFACGGLSISFEKLNVIVEEAMLTVARFDSGPDDMEAWEEDEATAVLERKKFETFSRLERLRWQLQGDQSMSLSAVMREHAHLDATNPRDKVFAMLGLASTKS